MTLAERDLARAAALLRAEFDEAFARAPAGPAPAQLDLLVVRVADHRYALKLSEVLAVHAERKFVAVPSPQAQLLGLVGLRGVIAPVYDLRALLGYPAAGVPRWLAQARSPTPFAVAFEAFERHLRLDASAVTSSSANGSGPSGNAFTPGSASSDAGPLPVLDLLAIYRHVTSSTPRPAAHEREETL